MKSRILWLFLLQISFFLQAQEKDRIAIVPFGRFDFHSEFSFREIAEHNSWETEELVYSSYSQSLLESLSKSTEKKQFFMLPQTEVNLFQTQIPKVYKSKPITHSGVDLSRIKENGRLESIMESLGADYLMFLIKYEIKGKMLTTTVGSGGSKFLPWSRHLLTYEVYNKNGDLVVLADQFEIKPKSPKVESLETHGTVLDDVTPSFEKVKLDVEEKLEHYKKKGKVIYIAK